MTQQTLHLSLIIPIQFLLFELEDINKIKNEDSFLKAISSFINEVTFNKKNIL